MRSGKIGPFFIPVFAVLISLATVSPARADLLLGFQNGLTGWSTYGDAGTVSASGGMATITESASASETDLYMSFILPTGAQSLQFTINSVSPDSAYASGVLPDAFGASFGVITPDPTGVNPPAVSSLVPTVDQTTDSFYTMDVVTNANPALAATGVTVSSSPGIFAQVSVDLPSNLDGQSAGILFRLIGGTDPYSTSTVTISTSRSSRPQPFPSRPRLSSG